MVYFFSMLKINQVIRTRRKTIAIIVRRDGQVIVRAPQRVSNAQILQFVETKAEWVQKKQAEMRARQAQAAPKQFASGETFLYLGGAYPLEITNQARPALALADGHFRLAKTALPRAKEFFTAWYKQQARQVLEERARLYASRFNLTYQQIKITSARTRWGSCSSRGTLSFTWRLVMAPLPVIDYVVIHELAHLLERNHSERFWQKVSAMEPDYAKHMDWLKENSPRLTLE